MSRVIADISISLDGYVTGPEPSLTQGLGLGGEGIHGWVLQHPRSSIDEHILATSYENTGAVVLGRNLFDIVDGPDGWSDDIGYGHDQDQTIAPPCFVVTHHRPERVRLSSRFQFVTGGVHEAIRLARLAAGRKDVVVMGGANVIDQSVAAGLVDQIHIHISPLLVGSGTRLFTSAGKESLRQRDVVSSPRAIHIVYDVCDDGGTEQ
ncbi:dihydrofolate reductase family protein [Leifsonia sp. RAF41]|uniref:dihydrofolate reductase family protein n=1 Tax=Leifsonia sp. RAF41 TaxID=3233056 RepID=UPI003F9AF608